MMMKFQARLKETMCDVYIYIYMEGQFSHNKHNFSWCLTCVILHGRSVGQKCNFGLVHLYVDNSVNNAFLERTTKGVN